MKAIAALAIFALVAADEFAIYKDMYKKSYASTQEEGARKDCFARNMKKVAERNSRGAEKHGWNHFTDLCEEEFKVRHSLVFPQSVLDAKKPVFMATEQVNTILRANATVDWRTKGAVTAVKDQGMCGSCWAFSSTGNMEGQHQIASGSLESISEEELVQCSKNGNMGCNGGLMDNAFKWAIDNKGMDSEMDYPYTSGHGKTGDCDSSKLAKVVAKFSSFHDVPHDETQMAAYVAANGPLAVAVDAADGWQTYKSGIMKNCNKHQLDHGVLIVGYGTEAGTDFWIVKNSWAATWGEMGYIRLERGTNQCGINMAASSIKV